METDSIKYFDNIATHAFSLTFQGFVWVAFLYIHEKFIIHDTTCRQFLLLGVFSVLELGNKTLNWIKLFSIFNILKYRNKWKTICCSVVHYILKSPEDTFRTFKKWLAPVVSWEGAPLLYTLVASEVLRSKEGSSVGCTGDSLHPHSKKKKKSNNKLRSISGITLKWKFVPLWLF